MSKEEILHAAEDHNQQERRVLLGKCTLARFLERIHGGLLVSGNMSDEVGAAIADFYAPKTDLPMLTVTTRFSALNRPTLCWDPFLQMDPARIQLMLLTAAEKLGCPIRECFSIYTGAILTLLEEENNLSLSGMFHLLENEDGVIARHASELGFSSSFCGSILDTPTSGIVLRRILESLSLLIAPNGGHSSLRHSLSSDSVICLQSDSRGLCWRIFQDALEEIIRSQPIRLFLFEADVDPTFFSWLLAQQQARRLELVFITRNAAAWDGWQNSNFPNIILSRHDSPAAFETLSNDLFGTYQHQDVLPALVKPPTLFFTFLKAVHWAIHSEERLKLRDADLDQQVGIFRRGQMVAVKSTKNSGIYLVPRAEFLA